jgi:hypothetical protein
MEVERERGGASATWSSTAAWRRRGSDPAAARCRTTVENAGFGATRVRRGADRWGRQHSAPNSVFKPYQSESNLFQTDLNLPQTLTDPKGALPCYKNFK